MPVDDYWGSESTELNVDEAVEVDLDGNPVTPGAQRDIPKSVIEAVGDLIVGTDVAEVGRVPIGTPGQALVVSPGGTTLEYATPASQVHTHDEYSTDADLADHLATAHAGLATDAELAAHEGAANPHPGYLTPAEGDAAYAPVHAHPYAPTSHAHVDADIPAGIARDSEVTAAVSAHEAASDPHPTYETSAEAAMKITAHEAAGNPHPTYHTSAEVAADIATHEGAADPHTGYLKESVVSGPGSPGLTYSNVNVPGTATTVLRTDDTIAIFDGTVPTPEAFGDSGSVGSAGKAARRDHRHAMPANPVTGHEAAADPHTGYQKESEKGAASGYAGLDAGTKVPTAQLGTGTADATKFLRGDQSWQVVAGGTSIPQQASEPAGSVANDLWIDTDEGAGVGLSSIIAFAENTSLSVASTFPALTDIPGLTVNITVPAGRRLKIRGNALVFTDTANTRSVMFIYVDGVQVQAAYVPHTVTNSNRTVAPEAVVSLSAGAHTIKLVGQTNGGVATFGGFSTTPAYLLVEDITGTLWPAGQSVDVGMLPILPACRVYHNTTQSIPNATVTALAYNAEQYDTTGAMHDMATNNGRIYAPVGGIYTATATLSWVFNATGLRTLTLVTAGSVNVIVNSVMENAVSASFGNRLVATGQIKLGAGDYVYAEGYQTSGGALNVEGGDWQCTLSLTYMGRAV